MKMDKSHHCDRVLFVSQTLLLPRCRWRNDTLPLQHGPGGRFGVVPLNHTLIRNSGHSRRDKAKHNCADHNAMVNRSILHASVSRRNVLKQIIVLTTANVLLKPLKTPLLSIAAEDGQQSPHIYFDMSIAGRPAGRVTIELYGDAAPASSKTFQALVAGNLGNRSGQKAGYRYAQGSRILKGKCVYLGRLNQIDAVNQSPGTPQRQQRLVEYPVNSDHNDISHDSPGLLTVSKGGSFEFGILAQPMPELDQDNIVIGHVVDGMDVVNQLVNVPTNRKTIRDGYRKIGKAIGDARANVQVGPSPKLSNFDIPIGAAITTPN